MMWNVAVSRLRETPHSTVVSNTSGASSSRPNTKLPLTITPRSWHRRIDLVVVVTKVLALRVLAQVPGLSVSNPTNTLRRPAAAARSIRSP